MGADKDRYFAQSLKIAVDRAQPVMARVGVAGVQLARDREPVRAEDRIFLLDFRNVSSCRSSFIRFPKRMTSRPSANLASFHPGKESIVFHRGVEQLAEFFRSELIRLNGGDRFDILVNNAGIPSSPPMEETTEADFDRLFAVNVKAPFFLVKRTLPMMRDGGRIINISSGVTRIAFPHLMAYNMTKGAVNTFTLHLAALLGPRQITVNAVMPGIVDTDATASWLHTPEGKELAAGMSALGRAGQPADIADIVAFLASPDAGGLRVNASTPRAARICKPIE